MADFEKSHSKFEHFWPQQSHTTKNILRNPVWTGKLLLSASFFSVKSQILKVRIIGL